MQATVQRMPMPGHHMVPDAGYTQDDFLVVQFREHHDPDKDAVIRAAIEGIALAADAKGNIIQMTIPLKTLLRTNPKGRFQHVIGDERVRKTIAMLLGSGFADLLVDRANGQLGWETTIQGAIDAETTRRQQSIVLWLDFMAKQLKSPRLSEFTSRRSWELEDQPVA